MTALDKRMVEDYLVLENVKEREWESLRMVVSSLDPMLAR